MSKALLLNLENEIDKLEQAFINIKAGEILNISARLMEIIPKLEKLKEENLNEEEKLILKRVKVKLSSLIKLGNFNIELVQYLMKCLGVSETTINIKGSIVNYKVWVFFI